MWGHPPGSAPAGRCGMNGDDRATWGLLAVLTALLLLSWLAGVCG